MKTIVLFEEKACASLQEEWIQALAEHWIQLQKKKTKKESNSSPQGDNCRQAFSWIEGRKKKKKKIVEEI